MKGFRFKKIKRAGSKEGKIARIQVEGITKCFKIPALRYDKLSEFLAAPWKYLKSRRLCVLEDISFEVYDGETFGIIGPNGAGKSTLLKILADILIPDKGKVIKRGTLVPFLELGVGFHPDMTVRENVFLNGLILGMSRKFLKERFDDIIDFAELREFVDVPLKNLSSGMRVRLAFSIAFLSEADIYLLDEVLAVGDLHFQEKSQRVLNNLRKRGKTIVVVSHNLDYIAKYADRALLLWDHKVKTIGPAKEVVKLYKKLYG